MENLRNIGVTNDKVKFHFPSSQRKNLIIRPAPLISCNKRNWEIRAKKENTYEFAAKSYFAGNYLLSFCAGYIFSNNGFPI